ncbi:MAG: hypothetical protein QOF71_2524 [Candidatus Eremiobacteraeota bacterium]|nr:hypothetical protein [Candidatus Eremiobacteraeota bacterium]
MTLELLNQLAPIATFVVVAATAGAAMVQLRHIAHNNQLESIIALRALRDSAALDESFEFVAEDLARCMQDPGFRAGLENDRPPDRTIHKELRLCDYFEMVGGYIKLGLISGDVFLEYGNPERYWKLCEPALELYRRKRGPSTYENFEYLVVCSQDWDRRHPGGNYPKGLRRLPLRTQAESEG